MTHEDAEDLRALQELRRRSKLPYGDNQRIDWWEVGFDGRRSDCCFGVVANGFLFGRGQTFAAAVNAAMKSRER